MSRRRWLTAAVPTAGIAALAVGASLAGAFNPQPDPPKGLGMIGVVEGQTLRLNAVNIALGGPDTRPQACRVRLGFADLEGRAIGDVEDRVLGPGQGTFVDLRAAGIGNPDTFGRTQVRSVARTIGNPNERVCRPVVSVELFGPEGAKTDVYIGDPSDG